MRADQWVLAATNALVSAGVESPKLEARLLACHQLGVDTSYLFAHPERELEASLADGFLSRRLSGEPLAYILGWREFYGRRFQVTPAVLIPRQETEHLVQAVIEAAGSQELNICEIGLGSGCVAITLALELPRCRVFGIELSKEALAVARANATALGASVDFRLGDIFTCLAHGDNTFLPLGDRGRCPRGEVEVENSPSPPAPLSPFVGEGESSAKFDIVVSNPPYIADSQVLPKEVAQFEPHKALFSGPTGLEFYERLAHEAPGFTSSNGKLIVEIGYEQGETVPEVFRLAGWEVEHVLKDLGGRDRIVVAARS